MARSISLIQNQILDYVSGDATLSPRLTSTSKRAIYRLFAFIVASAIAFLEQLFDIYSASVEAIAASAAPASASWLQNQVLLFQYSLSTPQVIQLINFAPSYPVVDETLRIISRASVTTDLSNNVLIKVATGEPPAALSSDEVDSLQSFINQIGVAGVTYSVKSVEADQMFIEAQIYFSGQFGSAIQNNVITAIKTFFATANKLNFNGKIKLSDLEIAIRNVDGVTDVFFTNVFVRDASTAFVDATALVLNQLVIARLWSTVAGYIVAETTSGKTLSDSLTFIPE